MHKKTVQKNFYILLNGLKTAILLCVFHEIQEKNRGQKILCFLPSSKPYNHTVTANPPIKYTKFV